MSVQRSRTVDEITALRGLDANLATGYGFGSLAIVLYDGKLLALAVAIDRDDSGQSEHSRWISVARKRRHRQMSQLDPNFKRRQLVITWGSEFT